MTESHPFEDQLIALALGDLEHDQATTLEHLTVCATCRSAYDEISQGVDGVLPAAPAVAPPAGFDARVLDRIEVRTPAPRWSARMRLLVAATAVIGICFGALAVVVIDNDTTTPTASDIGALLVTPSGSTVGSVEPSLIGADSVVVMQVTAGRPGTHYRCRLHLKDGSVREAGEWRVPASGRATWIAYATASSIDRVDLVTDDGRVWSSAKLTG